MSSLAACPSVGAGLEDLPSYFMEMYSNRLIPYAMAGYDFDNWSWTFGYTAAYDTNVIKGNMTNDLIVLLLASTQLDQQRSPQRRPALFFKQDRARTHVPLQGTTQTPKCTQNVDQFQQQASGREVLIHLFCVVKVALSDQKLSFPYSSE